jgi:adenylosuccinate synthase
MRRHAIIVVDLGFGDAGKGSVVDALTARYKAHTVVRYNGGAQAAHTVVTPTGAVHTFSQWGSGTFSPGVRTYLSEYMLVDPFALLNEELHLQSVGVSDGFARMYIDERALIVTPFARSLNRLREYARGEARHGSCGMGIGETMEEKCELGELVLYAGDMRNEEQLREKLDMQRIRMQKVATQLTEGLSLEGEILDEWKLLAAEDGQAMTNIIAVCRRVAELVTIVPRAQVHEFFRPEGVVIFEGAQGVLIDQDFGFTPYTTWSDTTSKNAKNILGACGFEGEVKVIGVLRGYAVRHGPGPFVSEDHGLTRNLPDTHNVWNAWQKDFRVGVFDAVSSRYALAVTGGIDVLAINCLDRLSEMTELVIATHYRADGSMNTEEFLEGRDGKGFLRDIVLSRPADQSHQEQLTSFLRQVVPVKTTFVTSMIGEFVSAIEQELGVSVALLGYGASRDKKEWKHEIIAL